MNEIDTKNDTKEKPKISKKQQGHVNKYVKNHYDRMNLIVPKGYRDQFKQKAMEEGVSLNTYVLSAVFEKAGIPMP